MPATKFESKRIPKILVSGNDKSGVLIGFCHIEKPFASKKFDTDPKYQVQVLLHKEDDADIIAEIETHVEELVTDTWGSKFVSKIGDGTKTEVYTPLVDGLKILEDDEEKPEYLADYMVLSLKNKTQPCVAISQGPGKTILTPEHTSFMWDNIYPGCYCVVSFGLYSWEAGGKMVCTSLSAVVKVGDGERLIGEGKPTLKNEFGEEFLSSLGILDSDSLDAELDEEELDAELDEEELDAELDEEELDAELDEEPEEEEEPTPKARGRRKASTAAKRATKTEKEPVTKKTSPRGTARTRTARR